MSCFHFGVEITGLKDDAKVISVIDDLSVNNFTMKYILAGYANDDTFRNEIANKHNVKDISDIDTNILKDEFVNYYQKRHHEIVRNVHQKQEFSSDGFTSEQAKSDALTHHATEIAIEYSNSYNDLKNKKTTREDILRSVNERLIKKFINGYLLPNIQSDNSNDSINVKTLKEEYDNTIKTLNNTFDEYDDNIFPDNEVDAMSDEEYNDYIERLDSIETKINADKKKVALARNKYLNAGIQYLLSKGNNSQKNYANLVDKILNHRIEWSKEVFENTKLLNISRDFNEILEQDKTVDENPENDNSVVNAYSESLDRTTDLWEDKLASSYDKLISADIKLFLDTIYKLNSTEVFTDSNGNTTWDYDTNNNLGVPMTMDGRFVIGQIIGFVNTSSVSEFYNGIIKAANSNPSLSGLIQVADKMKRDSNFANRLFTQLSIFGIRKTMVTMIDSGVDVSQSNRAVERLSYMIFNMFNNIRDTYQSYTVDDSNKVDELITALNKIKTDIEFDKNRNNKDNVIYDIDSTIEVLLRKYFPFIDKNAIFQYVVKNNKKGNNYKKNNYVSILRDIKSLLDTTRDVLNAYNEERARFNLALAKYKQMIKDNKISSFTKSPVFNIENVKIDRFYKKINPLAEKLINYAVIKNEFNSINADGNMSSDLIKNCYITNLIKQIQSGNEENIQAGLEQLAKEINKGKQYDYNPLFYGIYDDKGNKVRHGLFNRNPDGTVSVNKDVNATELLSISLFDGAKDSNNYNSAMYTGMTKGDYFLTRLFMFFNPVKYGTNLAKSDAEMQQEFCNLFLRTPADAPKNFNAQVPKYSIMSNTGLGMQPLYTPIQASADKYIKSVRDRLVEINTEPLPQNLVNTAKMLVNAKAENITRDKGFITINEIELYNLLSNQEINPIDIHSESNQLPVKSFKLHKQSIIPFTYKNGTETVVVYIIGDIYGYGANSKLTNGKLYGIYTNNNDNKLSETVINDMSLPIYQEGVDNGSIEQTYNTNNILFMAFRNQIYGELNMMCDQLNNIFEKDENGDYITINSIDNLFEFAHYKGDSIVKKVIAPNGKEEYRLTGNFFSINKLFNINSYSPKEMFAKGLSLYGGDNALFLQTKDGLKLNLTRTDIIKIDENGNISFNNSNLVKSIVNKIVGDFLVARRKNILKRTRQYSALIDNYNKDHFEDINDPNAITNDKVIEAILNGDVYNMIFDDLFEGSTNFYKDAQTFLKRAKEAQAGGYNYGNFDVNERLSEPIHNVRDINGQEIEIKYNISKEEKENLITNKINEFTEQGLEGEELDNAIAEFENNLDTAKSFKLPRRGIIGIKSDQPLKARNGFRAITIVNTIRPAKYAGQLKDELLGILKDYNGLSDKEAERIANEIAKGYYANTAINDAQSYISFEEFLSRRQADGTIAEYQDIIDDIMAVRNGFKTIADIDVSKINARIQIQKNFYYDIKYDATTRSHYPRQIKNAEFVLIPELLEGTELHKLWEFMNKYDIGQVNTAETSKAAKKNVITFWDEKTGKVNESFEEQLTKNNCAAIEDFYYRYLYKQQDVPEHMQDKANKAGIQIVKKILDNANVSDPYIKEQIDNFFTAYCANIHRSFINLFNNLGWVENEDAEVENRNGKSITFDEFYDKAKHEAQRLGIDSNFAEYLTPDAFGKPIMPNFMNMVSTKLESIAQSIFNKEITRQTFPGWHAAQLTHVGHGVRDINGNYRELKYHPAKYTKKVDNKDVVIEEEEYQKLSDEEKATYTKHTEAYAEVLVPRWSKFIPKDYDLSKLETEGLDVQIGYRIPTEGKQSITVMKVVGFLDDIYGSTVMVPDEWVIQTGSDFDVDSIYAIVFSMFKLDGVLKPVEYDLQNPDKNGVEQDPDGYGVSRRYVRFINKLLKEKIDSKVNFKDEIKKFLEEAKEDIRKSFTEEQDEDVINKRLNELYDESKSIITDIIYPANEERTRKFLDKLKDINKQYPGKDNIIERHNALEEIGRKYAKKEKNANLKKAFEDFADINRDFRQQIIISKETSEEYKKAFNNIISDKVKEEYKELRLRARHTAEAIADKFGYMTFEEFKKLSIDEQQTHEARCNKILQSFINIMSHESSREENYSRSNFDHLSEANKINTLYRLGGDMIENGYYRNPRVEIEKTEKGYKGYVIDEVNGTVYSREEINVENARSPYDSLDQIDFMDNVISGRKLKAFSVTRDTFNSVNNYIKSKLSNEHCINVTYTNDENTTIDNALASFDYVTMFDKNGKVTENKDECVTFTIKHNRLANSKNNRTVTGSIMTVESSQTTAHILDAVKEGSVFNETDYTFGVFKTLADVGIDYETSIAFLMQPAITRIVNAYNESNSVYTSNFNNPIKTAIANIAADIECVDESGKIVNERMSKEDIFTSLSSNQNFLNASLALFGADITKIKQSDVQLIALNKKTLQTRLQRAKILENSTKEQKRYIDAAYDVYIARTFENFYKTSDNITQLARLSNPDNFGAKQTISATREVINKCRQYYNLTDKEGSINNTIIVNKNNHNVSFIEAIYPNLLNYRVDVKNSSYPSLAAFMRYATMPSIEVNSKLFDLESETMNLFIKSIEKILNVKLKDEHVKEIKKYFVSSVYSEVELLNKPITLNEEGIVIQDSEMIAEYEKDTDKYWDKERARIFGYDTTQNINFEIEDINNPTKEELYKFNKLTPAQKVLWIKTKYNDTGIFSFLNVMTNRQGELRNNGFVGQSIRFNDQMDNKETIYAAFSNSFYHTSPIVRLAAIDLIKYAFVVEGFNFKQGSISKVIKNECMYNTYEYMGLDIINNSINSITKIFRDTPINDINYTRDFTKNFIRSHSNILRSLNLSRKSGKYKNDSVLFTNATQRDGFVCIPKTKQYKSLIDLLNTEDNNYINIVHYQNGKRVTTLYKIVDNFSNIYLVPLNKLEPNELSNYSANPNNNIYYTEEYYDGLIQTAISHGYITVEKNISTLLSQYENSKNDKAVIDKYRKEHIVPIHETQKVYEALTDYDYMINSVNELTGTNQQLLKNFITDVNKTYLSMLANGRPFGIVRGNSNFVKFMIPDGVSVVQNIDENGTKVKITKNSYGHMFMSSEMMYNIRHGDIYRTRGFNDTTVDTMIKLEAMNDAIRNGIKYPELYKIEIVTEDEVNKAESLKKEIEEEISGYETRESSIGVINVNSSTNPAKPIDFYEVDNIANQIYRTIRKQYNYFENQLEDMSLSEAERNIIANDFANLRIQADHFMQVMGNLDIDLTSTVSLHQNVGNILKAAVEYFEAVKNIYINKINNFIQIDDTYYKISDPYVYEYMSEHPEIYNEVVQLLLDTKTFGKAFDAIFNIAYVVDQNNIDESIKTIDSLKKIKQAINIIRNNNDINNGFRLLFNKYLTKEFSTNPIYKEDKYLQDSLSDVSTTFGDIDFLDFWLSDTGEVGHPQIQLVTKYIYATLHAASKIHAPAAVDDFTKKFDAIISKSGNFNFDNIITKDGKFIPPYVAKYLEDKEAWYKTISDIREQYGENSKEYITKNQEYERWKINNTEQRLTKDYYIDRLNNMQSIIDNDCIDYFIQYKELIDKLYDENTEESEKSNIADAISQLTNYYDTNNNKKDDETIKKINILKEYINENRRIRNKYFDDFNKIEFDILKEKYRRNITDYDNKYPNKTLAEKLEDRLYKEAYDWIKNHTIYDIDKESRRIINKAYQDLQDANNPNDTFIQDIYKAANAYDEYGRPDPLKLSKEDIAKIKEHILEHNKEYKVIGHVKLFKNKPFIDSSFYTDLFGPNTISDEDAAIKNDMAKKINTIFSRGFVGDEFNVTHFLNNVTESDLRLLIRLLENYKEIGKTNDAELGRLIEENAIRVVDENTFIKHLYEAFDCKNNSTHVSNEKLTLFLTVIAATDENGHFYNKKDQFGNYIQGTYLPNLTLYSYLKPINQEYLNHKKDAALKLIKDNVEYVPSRAYKDAAEMARRNNTYDEWFDANHIYNERTGVYEPLKIWMEQHIKLNNTLGAKYEYRPVYNDAIHTIKDQYKNKNYRKGSANYKTITGNEVDKREYNSSNNLSSKELEMLNLLQSTLSKYASTYQMREFINEGYLPRRAITPIDKKFIANQVLGAVGINFGEPVNHYTKDKDLEYSKDRNAEFDMLNLLKTKGTRAIPERPKRSDYVSEANRNDETLYNKQLEEYDKAIAEWKTRKAEIEAENLKLDNKILDRDWRNVFRDYIDKAINYNAKQRTKNTAYLLLEDLKNNKAYTTNNITGKVIESNISTDENKVYGKEEQKNAYMLWQNFIRRVFFNEFKKDSKWAKYGNLMQNMTSAKYMIFNVTGGIANVGTGMANIFNEVFAKEYFDSETIHAAKLMYLKGMPSYAADWGKETGSSRENAIIKTFDVVDYDAMLERRPNESIQEYARKVRNFLYIMQSGGEHYMQNTVLFAMLKSHRKYEINGKVRYGTAAEYTNEVEKLTMYELLEQHPEYKEVYINFIKSIKRDLKKNQQFIQFKKDINQEFINLIEEDFKDTKFAKEYFTLRDKNVKDAEKEFKDDTKHPTLESQIVYNKDTGTITFKDGSDFTDLMFGEFRQKVIQVNKRIHGVYDRIGAARIENEWYGGLIMQYHKHIYPGLMKRFRGMFGKGGIYNELRGTAEIGSYVTFNKLLAMEFKKAIAKTKKLSDEDKNALLSVEGIKNIATAILGTISLTSVYKNYKTLPKWEQRNLRRVFGDLLGMAAAMLIATLIYMVTDDDDEDEFIVATGLNIADRLLAEAQMYTPWGFVTEAKTLWSSPVAAQNGPGDAIKAIDVVSRILFDDEFDPYYTTGLYKGEHKLVTLTYRNIPAYRVYKRLMNMGKNNRYYRINENKLNMKVAKGLADYITD